jgi:protein O-GlcNAc transferase
VPVLTFDGDRWASRIGASILREAGLGAFVAPDLDGHVAMASSMANDPATPARLGALRSSMRGRLRASSACDVDGFARRMERTYDDLWRDRRRDR